METSPILLIEDDENDVLFFERALRKVGVTTPVRNIRDGQTAIEYLTGPNPLPQLIVLDLSLPRRTGIEVLQAMRAARLLIPVVVLSSSLAERDVHEAYAHGVSSFLVKPSDTGRLVELVQLMVDYWLKSNRPASPPIRHQQRPVS